MPHQCVRCNTFYEDGAKEILKGCTCGARLFFYIKKEKLEKANQTVLPELKEEQRQQIEHDVLELVGESSTDPVVLDIENVRVLEPGKYELDVVSLFQNKPLIFKLAEGKYVIDVAESFDRLKKNKR